MYVKEQTGQTSLEIAVDWELKSIFISVPGQRPVEYEFETADELTSVVARWLCI